MEIRLRLERLEPPAGRLDVAGEAGRDWSDDATDLAFVGWLGLLRALSRVLDDPGRFGHGRAER